MILTEKDSPLSTAFPDVPYRGGAALPTLVNSSVAPLVIRFDLMKPLSVLSNLKMTLVLLVPTIFFLALSWLIMPDTTHANGRVVQFSKQIVGPYEIAVGTVPSNPVVGPLHLTIVITNVAEQNFVEGATVTVRGRGPGSTVNEMGPLTASNNSNNSNKLNVYEVSTLIDREGVWRLTVTVNSNYGEASAHFPIEVRASNPMMAIVTLVAVMAFVVTLAFSLRLYLKGRGTKSESL